MLAPACHPPADADRLAGVLPDGGEVAAAEAPARRLADDERGDAAGVDTASAPPLPEQTTVVVPIFRLKRPESLEGERDFRRVTVALRTFVKATGGNLSKVEDDGRT